MSKTWTFVGGVLAGVASVFAAAAVAVGLEGRSGECTTEEERERLALPEGKKE